jgi:hypothetical protein
MIEIKVAAKETVKVTFGGNHGFIPQVFHFDAESMGHLTQKINDLIEERDKLLRQLGVEAEANSKLRADLKEARQPRVESCAPVYLIDSALVKKLNEIAIAMPEWRPIGTAPKDGTEILVWSNRGGVSCSKLRNQTWVFPGGFPGVQPTHWLPIPKPPTP